MRVSDEELDRMVDDLRQRIGVAFDVEQLDSIVTTDVVRRFALGLGDDNPLFVDPDHAAGSRWGCPIAPPTYLVTSGPSHAHGLPGVHALFAGVDIRYRRPVRAGDRIRATSELSDVEEREGRYAGRSFKQTYTTEYFAEESNIATLQRYSIRTVRASADASGKYRDLARASYTPEEISAIHDRYLTEAMARRGTASLDLGKLTPGDPLPSLLKGPLTVSDVISWLIGVGTGVFIRSSRQWYEFLDKHPKASVLDPFGIPDSPERVHWDDSLATQIGMPAPFDYGAQRIAWIGHVVTDWMGDNAWIQRLQVELRAPNYIGDLTTVEGSIAAIDHAEGTLEVSIRCVDQRDRVTATGTAVVATRDPEGWEPHGA